MWSIHMMWYMVAKFQYKYHDYICMRYVVHVVFKLLVHEYDVLKIRLIPYMLIINVDLISAAFATQ